MARRPSHNPGARMNRLTAGLVPLTALLLLAPALFNGFPLVYADTGTYLSSGFHPGVPADRPIGYGLFCRICSANGASLWGVVAAQALIAALVLVHAWQVAAGRRWGLFLVTMTVLSATTGLGWYTGRLLPDAFTAPAIVSTALLVLAPLRLPWRIIHAMVVSLACSTHFSHLLIIPATAFLSLAIQRALLRERASPAGTMTVLASLALAVGFLLAGNRIAGHGWVLSRGTPLVLLGRTVDAGAMPGALQRHCPTHHWSLCEGPAPRDSRELLWGTDSPVTRAGGWDAFLPEAKAMTAVLMADAEVRGALWRTAWRDAARQLAHSGLDELPEPWYRKPVSPPHLAIAQHLPHELPRYLSARQHGAGTLDLTALDVVHRAVITASLLLIFLLMVRTGSPRVRIVLLVALFAVAFAAACCAAISLPDQRFMTRVSGLLPFALALAWAMDSDRNQRTQER